MRICGLSFSHAASADDLPYLVRVNHQHGFICAKRNNEKKKRGNPQFLIPLNKRSPEERRRIQSMGGKARAENLRKLTDMRKSLELFLALPVKKGKRITPQAIEDVEKNMAAADAICMRLIASALSGQVGATEQIIGLLKTSEEAESGNNPFNIEINVADYSKKDD